ncbi:voltage-gated monoatomic cation channel TMEM109-like isoform X3 [Pseudochaenichthys georgianus]|uniref:voltage-gated monoatomic cation channel TMEM109-like isoform X3 n=1 Tax=Pseudochaenichthys georgianus TaxID=52239 RepID=UPI00146B6045|nr:transmembrane protein 109-like isoform X3 [Pseudochaenichthys georgianus]
MTFGASGSGRGGCSSARLFLLSITVLVLALAGAEQGQPGGGSPPPVTLGTLISGSCLEVQRYAESVVGSGVIRSAAESAVLFLESLLGQEHIYTGAMFLQMVIRFLAEGAASGLNVIAVYVAEILRVTGFDVALTLPRFTPEGVAAIAQWGLVALIGYWVLTIVLRVLICLVKRVFWVVKTVLALWLFGLIVTEKNATADTTAVRVGGLVLGCVLLTLLTSCSEKTCTVEQRLSTLESRVKGVEKKKGE